MFDVHKICSNRSNIMLFEEKILQKSAILLYHKLISMEEWRGKLTLNLQPFLLHIIFHLKNSNMIIKKKFIEN